MKIKITPFFVDKTKILGIFYLQNNTQNIDQQRLETTGKTFDLNHAEKQRITERVRAKIYNGEIKTDLNNTVFWQIEPYITIPYSQELLKDQFLEEVKTFDIRQYEKTPSVKEWLLEKCEVVRKEIEKIGMNEKYITVTNSWNKGKLSIEVKDLETRNTVTAIIYNSPKTMHFKSERHIFN
jgi:hypothetical protein